MWPLRRAQHTVIGLDIGTCAVKAVMLRHGRAGCELVAAAQTFIANDTPHAGMVAEPDMLAGVVGRVLSALPTGCRRVAVALPDSSVSIRRLTLPAMADVALAEVVAWEAEPYIPFDLGEAYLDFHVLSKNDDVAPSSLDVLVVAARREDVNARAALASQAGRQSAVVDVDVFALANVYEMNYSDRPEPFVLLVDAGRRHTTICLLEHGRLSFTGDVSIGGQAHIDALAREFGVSVTEAERLRNEYDQTAAAADGPSSRVLRDVTTRWVADIRRSLDSDRAMESVGRPSRVVLSGGASQTHGLLNALAAAFDAPAEVIDPFRRVTCAQPLHRVSDVQRPAFALAVGLALRQERVA